ncbi:MAG: ABC transporter ATP-binding protein [Bdellovibrionales bacterium]|nr:ABC transporter ATP-binding protein [Bdellovibrionales bacterium]
MTNILSSKLFARLKYEEDYLDHHLNFEVKKGQETLWFMEKIRWFQFSFALLLQVGVLLFSVYLWEQKALTIGQFTMVTSLSLLIINDARGLSRRFLEFFEYIGNINDGVSIMIVDHEIIDSPHSKELQVTQGAIQFKNVGFKYNDGKHVFKNLNLQIAPRERIGLVGFSGSGKSTLINLLLRLYEIQNGSIEIDGQSISEVTQDSLRDNIAMIPQDPSLFHRSLLENIRYGKIDATDDEVIAAAKLAHAHDFICEQPEGYASLVGERGVKLSGGQRQRIAIARAILKNSPILVLDEATSSLDSHTEYEIQQGLENLMKDKTVVVIAHRLSTISHLDRIIVFNDGEVVETGSHDTLLQNQKHYYHLWSMQAGGFLPL